jgi:hypothetical protein
MTDQILVFEQISAFLVVDVIVADVVAVVVVATVAGFAIIDLCVVLLRSAIGGVWVVVDVAVAEELIGLCVVYLLVFRLIILD